MADASRQLHLRDEGVRQAKEALGIFERIGDVGKQVVLLGWTSAGLALLLCNTEQLNVAEEAVFRAIQLHPKKGQELPICLSRRILADILSFQVRERSD